MPLRPPSLRSTLKRSLKGARAVALLAVGSPDRADDAAGLLVAEELQRLIPCRDRAEESLSLPGRGEGEGDRPRPSPRPLPEGERGTGSRRRNPEDARFAVFVGETVPENLTGVIRRFAPSHLLIVDAADLGRRPGAVALVDPDAPTANVSASTHGLPVTVLARYLRESLGCAVTLIGIQPASREFGRPPSRAVLAASRRVADAIRASLPISSSARRNEDFTSPSGRGRLAEPGG